MKSNRTNYFILILIFAFAEMHAQKALLDSAQKVLLVQKDDTGKVTTLNFISSLYRYTNTDTSGYFARQALALATKLNYERGIADAKVRISMNCATLGKYNEGLQSAAEALVIYNKLLATATGDDKNKLLKRKHNAYNVTAHNLLSQGNNSEGLKYSLLALRVAEELGEIKAILNATWNIANAYYVEKKFTESLKYMTASLKLAQQLNDSVEIASCYVGVAYSHMELNQNDTALKYCNLALQYLEGSDEKPYRAEAYNVLGIVIDRKGDYQQALHYDFEALKLYEEIGNKEQIPFVYNNIATTYLHQKKYNDALLYANKAIAYAKDIGSLSYQSQSYQMRAQVDSAQGNYPQAYTHYKLHILYRDSVDNEQSKKKIVQSQMQYDFDKKEAATKAEQEKKDVIAFEEAKQQRTIRNISFAGMAALILFGGFTYSKYVQRKKLSNQLAQSLTELKQTQTQLIQLEKEKEAEAIRLRISRDIHDDIGSNLTKIAMLGNLASAQSKNKMPEMTAQLNEISNYARTVNSSMSEIIWAVNPKQDTLENLLAYIRIHTEEFLKDTGINHQINFPEIIPAVQLNPDFKRSLFLVLKESLNNAVKYAEAKNISVSFQTREVLETSRVSFEFQITDDGKGFNVTEKLNTGNGLQNMSERVKQIGCDFKIESAIEKGTVIIVNGKYV